MRRPKTPEELDSYRLKKLNKAIRSVWQYDHVRKAVITAAVLPPSDDRIGQWFLCPLCVRPWPIELATVDHEPELGGLYDLPGIGDWIKRCFLGPQRAICKPCHKRKKRPSKKKKKPSKK